MASNGFVVTQGRLPLEATIMPVIPGFGKQRIVRRSSIQ
jgi:hypothetical protein